MRQQHLHSDCYELGTGMNASQPESELIEQAAKAEFTLHTFLTLSLDLYCVRGQDGYFKQLTLPWEKVLGWSQAELLATPWIEFVHPDDIATTLRAESGCSQADIVEYENRYRHQDGSYCWLSWRVTQAEDGLFYAVGKDITTSKQAEPALGESRACALPYPTENTNAYSSKTSWGNGERLEFERLITTLSTEFINLSLEGIDGGINHALQIIGEFSGCDRTYVVLFSSDGSAGTVAYEWCAESVESLRHDWQQFSTEPYPWLMAKLRDFEAIQVLTLADLPAEAVNTRLGMESSNTQSVLVVPIVHSKSLIGYLAFAAVKEEKTWSDETVALLRIVGEIFANVLNRTERKYGDSALRESEERFRAVFDQAAVGISLVHPSGQFIGINQRYCDLVGYTKSEMLQLTFQEITYPEDLEPNLEYRQQLYSGQIETFSVEKRYICKDGRLQWVNLTVSLMRDSAGVPKYTISVVEDIQERKQAEAALKESEERWQLALRGNNDSIWDLNFRTNQCFHSPRWGEMLGYEEDQSSNESDGWETRVHPDDIGRVMQVRQEHLQRKTPYYSAEYRIRCKDGRYKWILSRAQALWDEAGNPVRLVGSHTDISDRKQAEEALKASEEQFRSLSACSPVGIFLADVKGGCTYANPRLQEIVDLTFEQILGDGWTQAIYPDDREWVFAQWLRSVEAGQEDFKEYRFQTSEGIIRWVQVRSSPMHCAQGKLIGFVGTVEDINQRKQAEAALQEALSELEARVEERTTKLKQANEQLSAEIAERQHTELALRQSEEQFRRVFNEAPIGMSLENLEYRFIRVNRALCAMLGYTESELMALKCSDIVHPDDWKQEQPYFEQLLQGEIDSYQLEERLLKKNQQILWVNVTTIVLRDEAGQVLYILGMTEDITERKQAEEALRQSEQQFRAIVEDQTELIRRFKPDGTLTFVNGAYCRYFGKQHSELIGHRFDPEIPQDDQELVTQSFRSLSIEQPIVTYEYRVILPSGEIRWQQWTDRAMFDELGNLIEFQAVGRDITELKQAEAEILKALEKERELSELRSGFMSLVSHEFRTPLTTIQSSAELLERYNQRLSEEKKHNHLIRVQSAVRRMTQLLDDVLTIGKAEVGKLRFEPVPMDLAAFCSSIVETMQISAGSQSKLSFVMQGECTNVRMDEKLLAHIVTNLISNAIKYSPHGGTVEFELVCSCESAVLRIRDSGIGIPQKDVEQLFESFMRASNVGSIPGTGLGLAIVKKCVDLHGGHISVDSEVGVGTTFTVTLPLNC